MADWSELLTEVKASGSTHDVIRRKYLKKLADHTGRNAILYYSGWLQKGELARQGLADAFSVNDGDKNGFTTAIHGLERSKGLDLILHTPGGSTAATESLVDYLKSMFGRDIRAIVPQIAMSAGTMIALASKQIVMGKHSSLGPIDPQLGGVPAHGVIEEFERAKKEVAVAPFSAPLWQMIFTKYSPTLIGECEKAIKWSNEMVTEWLKDGMFHGDTDAATKADKIVLELGDHVLTKSHARHISLKRAKDMGINVAALEDDAVLQDAVLTVHHACIQTLTDTPALKIIENQEGKAFIQGVTVLAAMAAGPR